MPPRVPTMKTARMGVVHTRIAPVARGDAPARSAKPTLDFYGSASWKALRLQVQRECKRTCQGCGKTDTRIYVDHIVEMKDGGAPLERSNLQGVCSRCHALKTANEKRKRLERQNVKP